MGKFIFIIVVIFSAVWLVNSIPSTRKSENIQKLHRTGEAIAVDNLIQRYEREHQEFYKEEVKYGSHLEWPALNKKNLTDYCGKYLQFSIPKRTVDGAIGIKSMKTLHYEKENTSSISEIVVLLCKVMNKRYQYIYYMTRAPSPNCVYALKCRGYRNNIIFTIINRYCDFEDDSLMTLKRKRTEIAHKVHHTTGQPIAKYEYLLKYELEHQELVKREGINGEYLVWRHVMVHPNLDSYCYQYMGESAPTRKREDIKGKRRTVKLQYRNSDTIEYVNVTIVTCCTAGSSKVCYHIARATEKNCVYALLRQGYNVNSPFMIIFKHCNFEESNYHQKILQHCHVQNIEIPKSEVKEYIFDTVKTLQLVPKD